MSRAKKFSHSLGFKASQGGVQYHRRRHFADVYVSYITHAKGFSLRMQVGAHKAQMETSTFGDIQHVQQLVGFSSEGEVMSWVSEHRVEEWP